MVLSRGDSRLPGLAQQPSGDLAQAVTRGCGVCDAPGDRDRERTGAAPAWFAPAGTSVCVTPGGRGTPCASASQMWPHVAVTWRVFFKTLHFSPTIRDANYADVSVMGYELGIRVLKKFSG